MLNFYDISEGHNHTKEWSDNGNGKFAKVHFHIDTIGFNCMDGCFAEEKDNTNFHSEISEIIKRFDVVESSGYKQTKENLYAHPSVVSGIIAKSKIKAIAEAINNSSTMKFRFAYVGEEYSIIPDDEYVEILNGKRQAMAKDIVERCATKRTNQFYYIQDIAKSIMEKYKENRIDKREDINNFGITFKYVVKVIEQLVSDGWLVQVEQNGYTYIRSFNKTEQKKNKIDYDLVYAKKLTLADVSVES